MRKDLTWQDRMACGKLSWQEVDRYFYGTKRMQRVASESFCSHCPVRKICLEDALSFGDQEKGFRAGTTYAERERILNQRYLSQQEVDPAPTEWERKFAETEFLLVQLGY